MSIPPEAIIATLDDGTLVCYMDKLPEGTKYTQSRTSPLQVIMPRTTYPGVPVFVPAPTYTIALTQAEADYLQDQLEYEAYEDDTLSTSIFNKITAALNPKLAATLSTPSVFGEGWRDNEPHPLGCRCNDCLADEAIVQGREPVWTDGKHLALEPSEYSRSACGAPSGFTLPGDLTRVTCGNCKRTHAYKDAAR